MTIQNYICRAALVVMAFAAAQAAPIPYTIDFVTTSGIPPDSGKFAYDPVAAPTSAFTGFLVDWNSMTLDFTSWANNHVKGFGDCPGDADGSAIAFSIMAGTLSCEGTNHSLIWRFTGTGIDFFSVDEIGPLGQRVAYIGAFGNGPSPDLSTGTFTITASPVPEPQSVMLGLMGVLTLGWVRRRPRACSRK